MTEVTLRGFGDPPGGRDPSRSDAADILHWVLAQLAARSPRFSEILEGASIVLARDGRTDPRQLKKEAISKADLEEALRQQSLERVEHARLISLEPNGKITVLRAE